MSFCALSLLVQWRRRWVRRRWRCPVVGTHQSIGYRSIQYFDLGLERSAVCKLAVELSVIHAPHRSKRCYGRPRWGCRSASWLGFTSPLTLSRWILRHGVSLHGRRSNRFLLHPINSRPHIVIHHYIHRLSYIRRGHFHITLLVRPFTIPPLLCTVLINMHPFVTALL